MSKYIIDTNCLISFVTDRSAAQQKKIEPYFAMAADFKCTITIDGTTIAEFVYVLEKVYHQPSSEIAELLHSLLVTPGFEIAEKFDIQAILHEWPKHIHDYGDAAIAAVAASRQFIVLTFDRSFGKSLQKQNISCIIL